MLPSAYSLAFVIIATLQLVQTLATQVPKLPFYNKKEFSLETSYTIDYDYGFSNRLRVEEVYSREQKRAKLQFRRSGASDLLKAKIPREGTFFVADSNVLMLTSGNGCEQADLQSLKTFFSLHLIDWASIKEEGERDFIVGPVQLLFFLDQHRDQFRVGHTPVTKVKNMPSDCYEFEYTDPSSGDKITFHIDYAQSGAREAIPNRILVEFGGKKPDMTFDFALREFSFGDNQELERTLSDEPVFDQFAIPQAKGCSSVITSPIHPASSAIESSPKPIHSFSFRTSGKMAGNIPIDMFVAYEQLIDTLRTTAQIQGKSSTTISNFDLGRTYNVFAFEADDSIGRLFGRPEDGAQNASRQQEQPKQCIVFRTPKSSDSDKQNPFSFDELLAGGNDFIYLGQAQVRGVRTRAYEVVSHLLPVWLEQPVSFQNKWARANQPQAFSPFKSSCSKSGSDFYYSTVIYLADQDGAAAKGDTKDRLPKNWLRRIEINHIATKPTSFIRARQVFDVYDFSWQLASEAPNGQRVEDFLSLGDSCQAEYLDNLKRHASFSLKLTSEQKPPTKGAPVSEEQFDWLYMSQERNMAVLRQIQYELYMPATSIYDLESRFDIRRYDNTESTFLDLDLTFQWATPSGYLSQLTFHGVGSTKPQYKLSLLPLSVMNFQACFRWAAHLQKESFFAYAPDTMTCYIDLNAQATMVKSSKNNQMVSRAFDIHPEGPLEVFFVSYQMETTMTKADRLMYLLSMIRKQTANKFHLQNPFEPDGEKIEFNIKSADEHEIDEESPVFSSKLIGFGLLEADAPLNRLVEPHVLMATTSNKELESEMNLAQCQAACSTDLDCRSFSLCLRATRYECITSRVAFDTPEMSQQFKEKSKNLKIGDSIKLDINQEKYKEIKLRKHPTCELHSKRYLDFFGDSQPSLIHSVDRIFHRVADEESCARKCMSATIGMLHEQADFWTKITGNQDHVELARNWTLMNIGTRRDVCQHFLYLSPMRFSYVAKEQQDMIKQRLQTGDEDKGSTSDDDFGVCLLNNWITETESAKLKEMGLLRKQETRISPAIELKLFPLNYESFYEEQDGVSLQESELTLEEKAAVDDVEVRRESAKRESFETVVSLVKRNENLQKTLLAHENYCALQCFTQVYGPWPVCDSFDVMIEKGWIKCQLNSMSTREAMLFERADLIRSHDSGTTDVNVKHYEPKLGFILSSLNLARQSSIDSANAATRSSKSITGAYLINFVWKLFIATLGLVAGLLIGVKFGSGYLQRSSSENENSEVRYIVDSQDMEFNPVDKS